MIEAIQRYSITERGMHVQDDQGDFIFVYAHLSIVAKLEAENKALNALMELACADLIFFHSQENGPFITTEDRSLPEKIAFSVMCSELFYTSADSEEFAIRDAIPLRDIYRKDGREGVIRWVQAKRDNAPLRPHVEKRTKEKEDLRAENKVLREKLERLSAPVSDEEARENGHHDDWGVPCWYRTEIDTLLAARAAAPQRKEEQQP